MRDGKGVGIKLILIRRFRNKTRSWFYHRPRPVPNAKLGKKVHTSGIYVARNITGMFAKIIKYIEYLKKRFKGTPVTPEAA